MSALLIPVTHEAPGVHRHHYRVCLFVRHPPRRFGCDADYSDAVFRHATTRDRQGPSNKRQESTCERCRNIKFHKHELKPPATRFWLSGGQNDHSGAPSVPFLHPRGQTIQRCAWRRISPLPTGFFVSKKSSPRSDVQAIMKSEEGISPSNRKTSHPLL